VEKVVGSPLCGNVRAAKCTPDDLETCGAYLSPSPDSGTAAADAATMGCGIVGEVPDCRAADRRGVDGVSCTQGADCAPGFECVDGDKGPVCRRYCCSGSCENQRSQNGGPTFCDIQKVVPSSNDQRAPVCMPLKTCKLLHAGDCSDKETCAVVTEKGDTGCVPKGNAKVGESCDVDHCDIDLTCLGSPGDRRCYKLCRVDGADCGPMQTCTTGSVFQNTTFGVCKED
jgi:hypothetical protein